MSSIGATTASFGALPELESGGTTYTVEELACIDAGDGDAAIGELSVSTSDGQHTSWWCY